MITNAKKLVLRDAEIGSYHLTEVKVEYTCNEGFVYSSKFPIVSCTENGLDHEIGKCVKGRMVLFNLSLTLI